VGRVAAYLLDTDLDENTPADRNLTLRLYNSDLDCALPQRDHVGVWAAHVHTGIGV